MFSPRGMRSEEGTSEQFSFDTIWDPDTTQQQVFSDVSPLVDSAFEGYNSTIFAYGPSGKPKQNMDGLNILLQIKYGRFNIRIFRFWQNIYHGWHR